MTTEVGQNEICPCGSGKKYKVCCISKNFKWVKDENGEVFKQIPMSQEMADFFKRQKERREKQLGRPLRGDDTVFDPNDVIDMHNKMPGYMEKAGIRPELIYAFSKTGFLLTEENRNLMPDSQVQEWEDAIDEYFEKAKEIPMN